MSRVPLCEICKHLRDHKSRSANVPLTCDAFPDGIPRDILTLEFEHVVPHPGDHGIRFEARES